MGNEVEATLQSIEQHLAGGDATEAATKASLLQQYLSAEDFEKLQRLDQILDKHRGSKITADAVQAIARAVLSELGYLAGDDYDSSETVAVPGKRDGRERSAFSDIPFLDEIADILGEKVPGYSSADLAAVVNSGRRSAAALAVVRIGPVVTELGDTIDAVLARQGIQEGTQGWREGRAIAYLTAAVAVGAGPERDLELGCALMAFAIWNFLAAYGTSLKTTDQVIEHSELMRRAVDAQLTAHRRVLDEGASVLEQARRTDDFLDELK